MINIFKSQTFWVEDQKVVAGHHTFAPVLTLDDNGKET